VLDCSVTFAERRLAVRDVPEGSGKNSVQNPEGCPTRAPERPTRSVCAGALACDKEATAQGVGESSAPLNGTEFPYETITYAPLHGRGELSI
jgi:hypothetical protein